jgi:hypothetical protein
MSLRGSSTFLAAFLRQSAQDQRARVGDRCEAEQQLVAIEDLKGLRQPPRPIGSAPFAELWLSEASVTEEYYAERSGNRWISE